MRLKPPAVAAGARAVSRSPVLVVGSAHPAMGRTLATRVGLDPLDAGVESFPDGEIHVTAPQRVRGADVYLLQPTGPPTERHLLELMLLADACRRAGARRLTALIPYFGYARQDRRAEPGDAVGVRVIADMLAAARLDGIVVVDPHVATLEAISTVPVTVLSAIPMLAERLESLLAAEAVVVAPDLGAAKLAERYASRLGLPLAVVRKTRISGTEVRSHEVIGDVAGRMPVVVDDMISTGATIAAAAGALAAASAQTDLLVAATHGVFSASAVDDLAGLPIRRLLVTDSLPPPDGLSAVTEIVSLASLLADVMGTLVSSTG